MKILLNKEECKIFLKAIKNRSEKKLRKSIEDILELHGIKIDWNIQEIAFLQDIDILLIRDINTEDPGYIEKELRFKEKR